MANKPNLDDYVDVRERMAEFFTAYPEGTFQSECQFLQTDGRSAVVVKAFAYRTPDDPKPGQGLAYEFIPGKTPYTKDSELQNAETAAWGRAVIAVGAGDSKKPIASREEVRNRSEAQPEGRNDSENVVPNLAGRQALRKLCDDKGLDRKFVASVFLNHFGKEANTAPNEDLQAFVAAVDSGLIVLDPSGDDTA